MGLADRPSSLVSENGAVTVNKPGLDLEMPDKPGSSNADWSTVATHTQKKKKREHDASHEHGGGTSNTSNHKKKKREHEDPHQHGGGGSNAHKNKRSNADANESGEARRRINAVTPTQAPHDHKKKKKREHDSPHDYDPKDPSRSRKEHKKHKESREEEAEERR